MQVRHENSIFVRQRCVVLPRLVVALHFSSAAFFVIFFAFLRPLSMTSSEWVRGRQNPFHGVVEQHLVRREDIHALFVAAVTVEEIERWFLVYAIEISSTMV